MMRFLILVLIILILVLPAVFSAKAEEEIPDAAAKIAELVALGREQEHKSGPSGLLLPDYVHAAEHYSEAVELAEQNAIENATVHQARVWLAQLLAEGRGAPQDKARAFALLKTASKHGFGGGAYEYAQMLEHGFGIPEPDPESAAAWYRIGIRHGKGEAALALASLYERGVLADAEQHPAQRAKEMRALAVTLLKAAARQGDATSMLRLGRLYEEGRAVREDTGEALRWYEAAAKAGEVKAMLAAARIETDTARATEYMLSAARHGSVKAAFELGQAFESEAEYYLAPGDEEAFAWLQRSASAGNSKSIRRLTEYAQANGTTSQVLEPLIRNAKEGELGAMFALYRLYSEGSPTTPADAGKARSYLAQAANDPNATPRHLHLAAHYYLQLGDTDTSRRLRTRAANAHYVPAMLALADAYAAGTYGEKSAASALRWYERAAAERSISGMIKAASLYQERDSEKAAAFLTQALKTVGPKDYEDMGVIGEAYLTGAGFARSDDQALLWMERAARGEDPHALLLFSRMVRWGAVDAHPPEESITFLEKAGALGDAYALLELGMLYAGGVVVELDPARALTYFKQSAALHQPEALRRVGLAYLGGVGTERNDAEGLAYLSRAVLEGNAEAAWNLACYYRYPDAGRSRDEANYTTWLHKSAEMGGADAKRVLGQL